MQRPKLAPLSRFALAVIAGAILAGAQVVAVAADSSASTLPPEWHIHDGQTSLGGQHKGAGFFPTILEVSLSTYLSSPDLWARCPNATDKAFLPSAGSSASTILRAGVCMNDHDVIHLYTVPAGTSGPDAWNVLTGTDGGSYWTYYLVTPN